MQQCPMPMCLHTCVYLQSAMRVHAARCGSPYHYAAVGSLDDWRRDVARRCQDNSRLVLAVSAMFAGPLLHFTGATGGGFHLVGGSSSGKSTALRVAASVVGPPEYAREWRSTANGLEGVAVLHNDATLILDELAQIDPKQAGDAAYLLANGKGKSRANRAGEARAAARWRVLILSAGEVGLAQHMAEVGKQARAGQSVRLADVPAETEGGHGVFERLHDAGDGAALSALLKDAAARTYGAPWPLWMGYLTQQDSPTLTAQLRESTDRFLATYVPDDASGEVRRVAERFAVVAFAGELAAPAATASPVGPRARRHGAWPRASRHGCNVGAVPAVPTAMRCFPACVRSSRPMARVAWSRCATRRKRHQCATERASAASMRWVSPNTWCYLKH